MSQTYQAIVTEQGDIHFTEPVNLPAGQRVSVTVLQSPVEELAETILQIRRYSSSEDWLEDFEEDKLWFRLPKRCRFCSELQF
jgi:hypothetical protein